MNHLWFTDLNHKPSLGGALRVYCRLQRLKLSYFESPLPHKPMVRSSDPLTLHPDWLTSRNLIDSLYDSYAQEIFDALATGLKSLHKMDPPKSKSRPDFVDQLLSQAITSHLQALVNVSIDIYVGCAVLTHLLCRLQHLG